MSWRDQALCRQVGPGLHEPDKYDRHHRAQINEAKSVCAMCPVRAECLTEAIAEDDQVTIRGGLTPTERNRRARAGAA